MEPHYPRRLFPHHAGRRRGPLRGELGGLDRALYGVSALRPPRPPDFRQLYNYQLALPHTPQEFDEAHQRFLVLYNTTAPPGLLKEQFVPLIPLHVLGDSKGRVLSPQELTRQCAQALFVRTTNRYGCVTLPRSPFYVDHGLSQTPVWL